MVDFMSWNLVLFKLNARHPWNSFGLLFLDLNSCCIFHVIHELIMDANHELIMVIMVWMIFMELIKWYAIGLLIGIVCKNHYHCENERFSASNSRSPIINTRDVCCCWMVAWWMIWIWPNMFEHMHLYLLILLVNKACV